MTRRIFKSNKQLLCLVLAFLATLSALLIACDKNESETALYPSKEWFSKETLEEYFLTGLSLPEGTNVYASDESTVFLTPLDENAALDFNKVIFKTLEDNGCKIYKRNSNIETDSFDQVKIYSAPVVKFDENESGMFATSLVYLAHEKTFQLDVTWFEAPSLSCSESNSFIISLTDISEKAVEYFFND